MLFPPLRTGGMQRGKRKAASPERGAAVLKHLEVRGCENQLARILRGIRKGWLDPNPAAWQDTGLAKSGIRDPTTRAIILAEVEMPTPSPIQASPQKKTCLRDRGACRQILPSLKGHSSGLTPPLTVASPLHSAVLHRPMGTTSLPLHHAPIARYQAACDEEALRALRGALREPTANFRASQLEAIRELLQYQDLVLSLPTGGGKTLVMAITHQLLKQRAQAQGRQIGPAIVVVPVISLMDSMTKKLISYGMKACFLGEAQVDGQAVQQQVERNEYDVVLLSPVKASSWLPAVFERGQMPVPSCVVIDEAHIATEWRELQPQYDGVANWRRLAEGNATAGVKVPLLALSATFIPADLPELLAKLGAHNATKACCAQEYPPACASSPLPLAARAPVRASTLPHLPHADPTSLRHAVSHTPSLRHADHSAICSCNDPAHDAAQGTDSQAQCQMDCRADAADGLAA